MARERLTVGQFAEAAGVSIRMIHYYEQTGLLSKAPRTEKGYRLFALEDVGRIRVIKRLQELGFLRNQIAELIALGDAAGDRDAVAASVRVIYQRHLGTIQDKVRRYQELERRLVDIAPETLLEMVNEVR